MISTKSKLRKLIREELQTELFGFSALERAIRKVKEEIHPNAYIANISRIIYVELKPHIRSSVDADYTIKRLGRLPFGFEEVKEIIRELVPGRK